jgi:tryptophan-rich sensory protein
MAFIGVNVLTAMSGAVNKPGDWYEQLDKPDWRPPNWAFPVVWTILFAMIAVAGWMAWEAGGGFTGAPLAMSFYALQLILNALWSYLFFGLRRPDWALAEAGALWLSILATVLAFMPISLGAAALMTPYLIWVGVAFALNRSILRRNPIGAANG